MHYIVPPQVFISQRLIAHMLHKHMPSSVPVDLWEKQRIQEAYKVRPCLVGSCIRTQAPVNIFVPLYGLVVVGHNVGLYTRA